MPAAPPDPTIPSNWMRGFQSLMVTQFQGAFSDNALKQLVGAGTKLRPFPADVMTAAFKSANQVYDELNAKNEDWRKIFADYSKFRADSNLWFRFTEARFDTFMQNQKL